MESELGLGSHFQVNLALPCQNPSIIEPSPPVKEVLVAIADQSCLAETIGVIKDLGCSFQLVTTEGDEPLNMQVFDSGNESQPLPIIVDPASPYLEWATSLARHRIVVMLVDIDYRAPPQVSQSQLRLMRCPVIHSELRRVLSTCKDNAAVSSRSIHDGLEKTWQRHSWLVVDDDEINRIVACSLLRHLGQDVRAVDSGPAAIEAIADAEMDYILMDIHMPGMDGREATRHLKDFQTEHLANHFRIFGLTANVEKGVRQQCLDAGMDDVLAKPITIDDLRRILKNHQ